MEASPKEEVGGENGQPTPAEPLAPGQSGVLSAGQDCRVRVECPEMEHKLHKVYHVSITADMPGPKAICRQALKRGPPEQPPEPARSPRRTMWGQPRNDDPPGHSQLDGDYPGGPFVDDDEDEDVFEDGLLSEEMLMCSSAQHFSHSGLQVVEHKAEGFPFRDAHSRRLTSPLLHKVGSKRVDALSTPSCITLHKGSPSKRHPGNPDGLPTASETNGTSQSVDPRTCEASTSNQHILDLDLHNIAHTETLMEEGPSGSHECANGSLNGEGTSKETFIACVDEGQLSSADGEDLNCLERTPPGTSRLFTPGSSSSSAVAVKRKLLPSSETVDSCSEDEGLGKRWRGAESCQALHGSCRSTDSKGAPFWNHLLPSSRNTQKVIPLTCISKLLCL